MVVKKWVLNIIENEKNKYKKLTEETKQVRAVYGSNKYINMSEKDQGRLKDYQKIYLYARKQKL